MKKLRLRRAHADDDSQALGPIKNKPKSMKELRPEPRPEPMKKLRPLQNRPNRSSGPSRAHADEKAQCLEK